MKKPIFIIISAVIVVTLALIWAYLLFFGTPQSAQDVFSDLNLGGEKDTSIVEQIPVEVEIPVVNVERPALRQLTTKVVAGFREIEGTDSPTIYYSEKGTGHIYSIDLTTGEEVRISGTTVPGVYTSSISPNGDYVAMGIKSNTKNTPLVLGRLSSSTEEGLIMENFNISVEQFTIEDGTELLYTSPGETGQIGYSYNFERGTKKMIFELPFHEVIVQWGEQSDATHYFYPKSSYLLEGYLYQVKNKKISRLPAEGYGFTGLVNDEIITYTKFTDLKTKNFIYNRKTNETSSVLTSFLPEKCVLGVTNNLICAYENINMPIGYPDNWYQGTLNLKDSLWLVSGNNLSVELLVDTYAESDREIDITNLNIGESEIGVYFINKNDNTLWMYEL